MDAAPVAWFSRKEDALHVKRALYVSGIKASIGRSEEPPAGWLMGQRKGVYLWVSETDLGTARAMVETLRPVSR